MTTKHEKAVIGLIANNPDIFDLVYPALDTIDFSEKLPGIVFSEMKHLSKQGIRPSRQYITSALDGTGYKQEASEFLSESCSEFFEGDVLPHVKAVKQAAKQRNLIFALDIAKNHSDPVSFLLNEIEKFMSSGEEKSQTFRDLILKTTDFIEQITNGITGIQTGVNGLDRILGGFQPGKVYTVAARPGVGKTALTMQLALNMAGNRVPVGVCSLEMSDDELGMRSISNVCKADISGLYRADDIALTRMTTGIKEKQLAGWPIFFNTEQYTIGEIMNQIRLWARRDKIQCAVVDHIGLVEVPEAKSALERISYVTRMIKKLSKELDIAIIQTSQLNRSIEKSGREPILSDLRDSGSIEQDSDVVMFLHEEHDDNGYNHHKFIISKNRSGRKGYVGAGYWFDGSTQTFTEVERESFATKYAG